MNMWIRSADFGPESFLFSSQAKVDPPEEKSFTLFLACMCMTLHEKDVNVILHWLIAHITFQHRMLPSVFSK